MYQHAPRLSDSAEHRTAVLARSTLTDIRAGSLGKFVIFVFRQLSCTLPNVLYLTVAAFVFEIVPF